MTDLVARMAALIAQHDDDPAARDDRILAAAGLHGEEFYAALGDPDYRTLPWDDDLDPFGSVLAEPVPVAAAVVLVGGTVLGGLALAAAAGWAVVRAGRAVLR